MILNTLPSDVLHREAVATNFPKWNTLCLLRSVGLPTLNAAFLPPGMSRSETAALVERFATTLGSDRLLVRSDGGREAGRYFRGGNTLPLNRVVETAITLLNQERAVILLEPTNRFTNRLAANFRADSDGKFAIEVLGPGYDVADLNRGGTPAHYRIYGEVDGWDVYQSLSISDIRGVPSSIDEETRRQGRLTDMGMNILPGMGEIVTGSPAVFSENWLRSKGYDDLWRPWRFELTLTQVQSWYEDAFLVANLVGRFRKWKVLVLTLSKLHDSRLLYWDVVDASTKFALPAGAGWQAGNMTAKEGLSLLPTTA